MLLGCTRLKPNFIKPIQTIYQLKELGLLITTFEKKFENFQNFGNFGVWNFEFLWLYFCATALPSGYLKNWRSDSCFLTFFTPRSNFINKLHIRKSKIISTYAIFFVVSNRFRVNPLFFSDFFFKDTKSSQSKIIKNRRRHFNKFL